MIETGKIVTALVMAFAMVGGVYADMTPAANLQASFRGTRTPGPRTASPLVDPTALRGDLLARDLSALPLPPAAREHSHLAKVSEPQGPAGVLAADEGSLSLCLYTLLGLGLCRSGHWVKRAGLGYVPDWYHSGAPYQIGASRVLGPDLQHLTPSLCQIQPDATFGATLSPPGSVEPASLCRMSQRTLAALAYRGPPLRAA